ncbi:hypothetical protein F5Y04DRAFT_292939, partial [Hypomontagnella monticulosa]
EKYDVGAVIQRATGTSLRQAVDSCTVAYPYHRGSTVGLQCICVIERGAMSTNDYEKANGNDNRPNELRRVYAALQEAFEASDPEHPEVEENARKLDRMAFSEFCHSVSPNIGSKMASIVTTALLGVESQETTSEGLASELPLGSIHLNTIVKTVGKIHGGLYEVHSTGDTIFTAKHIAVSIPTTLYHTIEFNPPLPKKKQTLSENAKLGYSDRASEHGAQVVQFGMFNGNGNQLRFTRRFGRKSHTSSALRPLL